MSTEAETTTRERLVTAARALFTERGFVGTGTEAILEAAGASRGSLYHHFSDKTDLFRAVYEQVEEELVTAVVEDLGDLDPTTVLERGASLFLDACLEPAVQRIVLLEGPGVLGWEQWREIDQRYGLGLVHLALEAAMDAGVIEEGPVEPLAHILMGGLIEAALLLAHSPEPERAREDIGRAVSLMLEGLRPR